MKYLKSIKEMLDPMGKWDAEIPALERPSGTCEDCNGEGFILWGKSGIKKKCYGCDGQGFNGEKGNTPCQWCEAKGSPCDICKEEEYTCLDCKDTFKEECFNCKGECVYKCYTCNGSGNDPEDINEECNGCQGRGECDCDDCYGSGQVDCSSCC